MSFDALTAATTFDKTNSEDVVEQVFGRNNWVEMELYQALPLMTDSQKRILDDMIDCGGKISLFRIALGEGQHKHGLISFSVCRDWAGNKCHVDVSPRGAVSGTIFPGPFADADKKRVKVKSFSQLQEHYVSIGLYDWDRASK